MARIVHVRFDVWLVTLDPTLGSEMNKTRPSVIISPSQINDYMNTVIVAPLTSTITSFPFRVNCKFDNHQGQVALDHSRGVDKNRLVKRIGQIDGKTAIQICDILQRIYQY